MLIKRRAAHPLTEQDVTPEAVYQDRRLILKGLGLGAATLAFPTQAGVLDLLRGKEDAPQLATRPLNSKPAERPANLVLTPEEKATSYNNFYELGTDKSDPARNAHYLKPEPWTLKVEGEVAKPFTLDVWDLINKSELEERIYRLRCVEAWSMVLPWNGISLAEIIRRAMARLGLAPERARIALCAPSQSAALEAAARELSKDVRYLALCAPNGERLARTLRWDCGASVHTLQTDERIAADLSVCFDDFPLPDGLVLPLGSGAVSVAYGTENLGDAAMIWNEDQLICALYASLARRADEIWVKDVKMPPDGGENANLP